MAETENYRENERRDGHFQGGRRIIGCGAKPSHRSDAMSDTPSSLSRVREVLGNIGYTHERKALALSILGLFSSYFLLLMLVARDQMPEWYPAFSAMFALYFIAFFGVAAHWFWGRWVAIGLGTWGATIAIWGIITQRSFEPALVILGVTHGLVALLLMGSSMGAHYEDRPDWRTRFGIDDEGVKRLRRSVTRAASSLPAIVLFALAPRQEEGAMVLAIAVLGITGLLLGRTVALFALTAAAFGSFAIATFGHHVPLAATPFMLPVQTPQVLGLFAGIALTAAVAPFVGPMGAFLKRR
jgi:hypothetical protein